MSFIFEVTEKGDPYITVKGFEGPCKKLVIPDEGCINIDSDVELSDAESVGRGAGQVFPVRIIGNHAFSSRKDLEEVVIPDSIHTVLGFAFHNCGKLRKISLTDSIEEYLDGGTRQCESLCEIEVDLKRGKPFIIRRILEDNDRRLTFRIHMPGGEALVVFPGFNYDFVENTMARTIQFAIEGTGYAYREVVKSDQINFREYDNLFSKVSADDRGTAEMIAIARLLEPYELSDEARITYENWLKNKALKNLTKIVKNTDRATGKDLGTFNEFMDDIEEHIDFYLKRELLDKSDARELAHIAADMGITAIVSMLMDYAESDKYLQKDGDNGVTKDDDNMLELDF
ncbi:leucine-rich repeat protein [Butyrivibrio sp. VCD2006]|uniref:leucine-rich repeat protein n=1 Tax=Butyrivibrio sp. VCD2006 TaxID=1280664 RepID=UPI00040212C2|nr:leucine-rich repeat protein [Butyrivibrio sp. VCD2006]